MRKNILNLSLSLLTLLSFNAFASQESAETHYVHGPYAVSKYRVSTKQITFFLKGANAARSTCNGNRFKVSLNDPNYETKKTAILSAFMAQKPVTVHLKFGSPVGCAAEADIIDIVH